MIASLTALVRAHAFALSFAAFALGVIAVANGALGWYACAVVGSACATLAFGRRVADLRPFAAFVGSGFALGSVCAALAMSQDRPPPYAALAERHVVVRAVVIDRPRATAGGESARVRIVGVDAPSTSAARSLAGTVALLDVRGLPHPDTFVGRSLRIHARLDMPAGVRNDGEPSEKDVLADQGVAVILAASGIDAIRAGPLAGGWEPWWARLRLACARAVERRLPAIDATVLEGILWGDRGNLPAALRQEFSDTGTVHVLTTAGLHLGIFAALVAWLMLRVPISRPWRVALVLIASWGYATLAGLHLPTVRAATMLTAGAIAHESGRGRSPSAVLAAAASAVALPHPLVILTPSFAMSFSCVCGIALVGPVLEAAGMRKVAGVPDRLVELARTSFAVQIALWPLQALYFNAFTPYALIANMLVVPLVGVVMALGGMLVCATALAPPLTLPIGNLAWWAVALLTGAVERFASLPYAHIDLPPPTHAFLAAYWLALIAASAWSARPSSGRPWNGRALRSTAAATTVALALIYIAPGIRAALDPDLHVDAIDVGQADCILIRAPGLHAMLVDGGGKLERAGVPGGVVAQPIGDVIATRTVMPFLLRHWVLHLDAVVLTHPHGDHAGGLPVILARERVGALYDSAQLYGGPAYQRTLEVVRERHVRYRAARRGESFDLTASTHVAILAPELPLITGTSSDINNNSVVLRVGFGKVSILLTGDAQSEAEARLLSHGGADLRADILKVGHHGSAYSSTPAFLAAVHPRVAIISCGLHNVFGHPSPRTLAALRAAGATVYRTDTQGGISFETDGRTLVGGGHG